MAKLTISTFWKHSSYWNTKEGELKSKFSYPQGGGYYSFKEMQAEIVRRNDHRNPELLPNGVRIQGDCGTYQEITWEDE